MLEFKSRRGRTLSGTRRPFARARPRSRGPAHSFPRAGGMNVCALRRQLYSVNLISSTTSTR